MKIEALLDTNVLVAASVLNHPHHESSAEMFERAAPGSLAVAAHSFAETYTTLTRRGVAAPYRWTAQEAAAALDVIRSLTVLIGLTPAQALATVRSYADEGGLGARVYDKLIGQVAVAHGVPAIVTWNIRHMRPLFSELDVRTPTQWSRNVR